MGYHPHPLPGDLLEDPLNFLSKNVHNIHIKTLIYHPDAAFIPRNGQFDPKSAKLILLNN